MSSYDATYWTDKRVLDALRTYVEIYGAPAGSKSYDETIRPVCKGKKTADRPYPDSAQIRKRFPTMAAAWKAAGFELPVEGPRSAPPSEAKKFCKKCGETKPVEAFGRHGSKPDGLQYWCKTCTNLATRRRAGTPATGSTKGNGHAKASTSAAVATIPAAASPALERIGELEGRVDALENDRRSLLTVVRLLVEGDGAQVEERRELVRVGIVVGATAYASGASVLPPPTTRMPPRRRGRPRRVT